MTKPLYFATLADRLGHTAEDAALLATVTDVRAPLADNAVRVTMSRQFATLDTPVNDQHEIALLSTTLR